MVSKNRLTIPGNYDRIHEACDFVVAGAETAGFGPDEVFRIQLACDEACTNIIEHAYGGEGVGKIDISWKIEKGAFIIEMRDTGHPFSPKEVKSPTIPSNPDDLDQLKVGGLGLHFMRTLMDKVEFSFNEEGNRLLMIKNMDGTGR